MKTLSILAIVFLLSATTIHAAPGGKAKENATTGIINSGGNANPGGNSPTVTPVPPVIPEEPTIPETPSEPVDTTPETPVEPETPIIETPKGGGGVVKAFNYTKSKYELFPQCFPEVTTTFFYSNDILTIWIKALENQEVCREARKVDFRF